MPAKGWPELIPSLRSNMERQPNSGLRQSTLECLGYICEEAVNLDDEDPLGQDNVNSVLTAIVQGIGKSEPDANVRLAATLALQNALEFAETNFQAQGERDFLMQVVCEGTMGPTARVREASFECLAGIAALHYSKLGPYMAEIFKLTQRAIREDEEPVAKQAIEFWCTICEEELEIEEVASLQALADCSEYCKALNTSCVIACMAQGHLYNNSRHLQALACVLQMSCLLHLTVFAAVQSVSS